MARSVAPLDVGAWLGRIEAELELEVACAAVVGWVARLPARQLELAGAAAQLSWTPAARSRCRRISRYCNGLRRSAQKERKSVDS